MSQVLYDDVLTVIKGKPHKFFVRFKEGEIADQDFARDIQGTYYFEGKGQSPPSQNLQFTVKVTQEVILQPNLNQLAIHNVAIAFGLESIRRSPGEREFVLATEEFNRIASNPRREGQELRSEILEFISTVNQVWPGEVVSFVDLEDNLIGLKEPSLQWLNQLQNEGLLDVDRGFKDGCPDRRKPRAKGHLIAAKAREEVLRELTPDVEENEAPKNSFYILVDLEVERKGPFVFVIMPFKDSEFPQAIYDSIIRPSVEDNLRCTCVRNDEDLWPGQLDDKFYSHIVKCELLIAELTTENPNVVYELGLAHALNKDVIILVNQEQKKGKLSFDYDKFGAVFYSDTEELKTKLIRTVQSLGAKLGLKP